ncbi:MAG: META domain-containing protein [bacterium]
MKNLVLFLFSLMLLFSCKDDITSPAVIKLDSLSGTEWSFDSFVDNNGTKHLLSNYTNMGFTLNFASDYASGISGCNNYSIDYKILKDNIEVECRGTTKVYCTLTGEYFSSLLKSNKFYATKTELTLYTKDTMMVRMYFKSK